MTRTRFESTAEVVFAAMALIWLARATDLFLYGLEPRTDFSVPWAAQGILIVVLSASLLLAFRERRSIGSGLASSGLSLFVVAVAIVSVLWTESVGNTALGAAALVATTCTGLWFAHRFGTEDQLRILASVLVALGVTSAGLVWLLPGVGLETEYRGTHWAGVFADRNTLGSRMALAVVACGSLWAAGRHRGMCALGMLICGWALFASGSRSAWISAVVGGIVVLGIAVAVARPKTSRAAWLVLILPVALGVLWLVFGGLATALELLGRDTTFSSRTEIWSALVGPIREHLWLGHGFNAFWSTHTDVISNQIGRAPIHAHNGWLDLLLELGLLGFVVFLVGTSFVVGRAIACAARREGVTALWPAAFLAMFVVHNLTGSALVRQNRLEWVLFVGVAVWVSRSRATEST